jgi:hypothetical protein
MDTGGMSVLACASTAIISFPLAFAMARLCLNGVVRALNKAASAKS